MKTKTTNENLVNNSNQPQSEQTRIINELKINKMSTKNKIENLKNKIDYSQNEVIEMKEELNELNTNIEEIEIQMDELEFESYEYGELEEDLFIYIKQRDMIENQLERSELLKIWRILDKEITDIISYIDDYNTGMLQQYQGDTTSVEFERNLEGKEEVLPELEDKSDKIWDEIQELEEQFESIKN